MEKEYHKLTIKPITLTVSHREQPSQSTINFILGTYKKGDTGLTPYIGENGNWWIGTEDTGVHAQGDDGADGTDGNGIESIFLHTTVGKIKTYRITFTDTTTFDFSVTDGNDGSDGVDGEDGRGIVSIELHDTQEKTKTYRITYTDATYTDFDVIDGNDGQDGLTPYIGMNGNWFIGVTDTGVKAAGTNGTNGEDGNGIVSIIKTGTVDLVDEYTITFTDLSTFLFYVTNGSNGTNGNDGQDGSDGRGITSIIKTSTVGLVDTYTITYSDSTTSTFDVTNGANAEINHDATLTGSGTSGDPLAVVGKTIDITTAEFSGTIDETNDKFTIWDNSLLKWIKFSFTSMKTWLSSLYQLKNLKFTDTAASTWVADTTYTTYLYRCELTLSGVAATDIAEVIFAHAQAISGNYSPVSLTATNKVTIYSKVNTAITIPTIIISKN